MPVIPKIKVNPRKAILAAKQQAQARLRRLAVREEPERLFEDIIKDMPSPRAVINMSEHDLKAFLSGGKTGRSMPPWPEDRLGAFEREIGAEPWHVSLDQSGVGERTLGAYSLSLASLPEDAFCMIGDVGRLFDPERDDYTRNIEEVVCAASGAGVAMAYAMVSGMATADAASSPSSVLSLARENPARTKCRAFLTKPPRPEDVSVIVASDEDGATKARALLESIGKAVPVAVFPGRLPVREVERESAGSLPVVAELRYFEPGDRVRTKLTASIPSRKGVISDAAANRVVVEWDDAEERTAMDLVEAMASLMWEPREEPPSPVVYSLPGMDEETCSVLASAGVDPVDLYALASHHAPSSPYSEGWQDSLIEALSSMGVDAVVVDGHALRDGKFGKSKWIEGRVGGNRLVVDLGPGRLEIRAGNPWTHVAGSSFSV